MKMINTPRQLPSVHILLRQQDVKLLIKEHGTLLVTKCAQKVLTKARSQILSGKTTGFEVILKNLWEETTLAVHPSLRPVINLTGIVLHTNLGRAALPEAAIHAITDVSRGACNLEFNLETGKRDDRYKHSEALICQLTGAGSALVVNNNAAAVLLILNSLAKRKEVPVSRGELIEIGGSFRMPDIMAQAGCKLIEVGTTNRTYGIDFEMAITSKTALLMKVHTSNFEIKGFTKSVPERELVKIAHNHKIPLITDLGSGTLINLETYKLPYEITVTEALETGADLVTFSGDKLLGGPQTGIIVGRHDLIEKLKRNPLARAMRPDKITLAALQAVLQLYNNPTCLKEELPTLRWLSRKLAEIEQIARSLLATMQHYCEGFTVIVAPTQSQVGSGALPTYKLESIAFKVTSLNQKRSGKDLNMLAQAFRDLPVPVIGRIKENALWFDLRCLEDLKHFKTNLQSLVIS